MSKKKRQDRWIVTGLVLMALVAIAINVDDGQGGEKSAVANESPGSMVEVALTSDPTGATVFLDDEEQGTTPITVAIPARTPTPYRVVMADEHEYYDLYKLHEGELDVAEDTAIDVWITRTTALEQAEQRYERKRDRLDTVELQVRRACNDSIRKGLRAPSTAKFPGVWGGDWEYTMSPAEGTSTYAAYVDAENGFGAMIRSHFACQYDLETNSISLLYFE